MTIKPSRAELFSYLGGNLYTTCNGHGRQYARPMARYFLWFGRTKIYAAVLEATRSSTTSNFGVMAPTLIEAVPVLTM